MKQPTKIELINASGTYVLRLYARPMKILGSEGPDFQAVWSGKSLSLARRKGNAFHKALDIPFKDKTQDVPVRGKRDKIVSLYRRHADGGISRASLVTQLRKLGVPLEEIRFQLDGFSR